MDACDACAAAARAALRDLCEAVYVDRLDAALAAVACCEIGGAALDHAEAAARRGWGLPAAGGDVALPELSPFWLDRDDATTNDVALGNAVASFRRRPPYSATGPNAAAY